MVLYLQIAKIAYIKFINQITKQHVQDATFIGTNLQPIQVNELCDRGYVCICFFFFLEIRFLCVALDVLELTPQNRLGSNSEIPLPLSPQFLERHALPPPGCILFLLKDSCLFCGYECFAYRHVCVAHACSNNRSQK